MKNMKKRLMTRKDIMKAILQIALEISKIIGTALGATLMLIFEFLANCPRYTPIGMLLYDEDLEDDEFLSFDLYENIGDYARNIKDYINDIKEASLDIKLAKTAQVQLQEEVEKKELLTKKDFKDDIIEYIRDILLKLDQLPKEEQKYFTEKLKAILADYTSSYFDALKNPSSKPLQQDLALLARETALEKLVTIDLAVNERIKVYEKISAISVEEKEIMSMMQSSTQTSPPQEEQKLEMRI